MASLPEQTPTSNHSIDEWLGGFVIFGGVVTAVVGGVGSALALWLGTGLREAIAESPLMLAWAVVLVATGTLAWAGFFAGLHACVSGWKQVEEKRHRHWLLGTAVVLVAAVFSPTALAYAYDLKVTWPLGDKQTARVIVITTIMLIPALTAVLGMWFAAVEAFDSADKLRRDLREEIANYLELDGRVRTLLWFVGIVIAGVVLATGTLRQAMIAGPYAEEPEFPAALVLAYGGYFTLVLILAYVSPHVLLRRAGARLVEQLTDATEPVAWLEQRRALTTSLGLDRGLQEVLVSGLVILAPLLAGIASLALPGQ